MKTKNESSKLVVLCAVVLAAGCAPKAPQVEIASSAGEAGYAAAYPERFDAENKAFDAISVDARAGMAELQSYPGQISSSDWTVVRSAYERADAAGRSEAYAEGAQKDAAVRQFFDEERDDIGRRVTGAVQSHIAKEATGVEVDVAGPIAYALKDGVAKRMEKRLEASNEAQQYLDRNEAAIGKKDADVVETQVNHLSRTCYLVNIAYTQQRLRITRMRGEAGDVKDTLGDELEAEGTRCQDPALAKGDKQECEQRLAELQKARARLDEVVNAYNRTEENLQAAHDALVKEYKDAFEKLLDAVDEKIKAAPAPAPAK
jgi:hypothetical protein